MLAGAGVLARVAVWRRVAAERYPAGLSSAQVHPARMNLDALLALVRLRRLERLDGFDVGTGAFGHVVILSWPWLGVRNPGSAWGGSNHLGGSRGDWEGGAF